MKQKHRYIASISLALLMGLLSACSNESPSPESVDNKPDKKTGIFQNGRVVGLGYKTETLSGVTNDQGEYEYREGETIAFHIGRTQLGNSVPVSAALSPKDLVEGVTLPKTGFETRQFQRDIYPGSPVKNLSRLLALIYTMDSDKDASNGVIIEQGAADFIDINYDLTKDYIERRLLSSIYKARNAGYLANAVIVNPFQALNYYFADLSITPQLYSLSKVEEDSNGDGVTDSVTEYTYDGRGNQITQKYENINYGLLSSTKKIYDANNQLIRFEIDSDNDGKLDEVTINIYDTDGRQVLSEQDTDGDGKANKLFKYTYDVVGNISSYEKDTDGDGVANEITQFTYSNNVITELFDSDGDGSLDRIIKITHDDNGNLLRSETDSDGDGFPNSISNYVYDNDGQTLSYEVDSDANGKIDQRARYTYDANGNETLHEYDSDGDNQPNSIKISAYDSNSNKIREVFDSDGDGKFDRILEFTYDAKGREIRSEFDFDHDGVLDLITEYVYNTADKLLRKQTKYVQVDLNEVTHYEYDANGLIILKDTDTGEYDSSLNKTSKYQYDENGYKTREEIDKDRDGKLDSITTYTYISVPAFSTLFNHLR